MLPQPADEVFVKVVNCIHQYAESNWHSMESTAALMEQLGEEGRWLLSWAKFFAGQKGFYVNATNYYAIPSAVEQVSTMQDFADLFFALRRKRITKRKLHPDKEALIVRFLQGCTSEVREYYEIVMSKATELNKILRHKEVTKALTRFTSMDLYSASNTEWNTLSLPVMVTTVPKALPMALIYKSPRQVKIRLFVPGRKDRYIGKLEKVSLSWLKIDAKTLKNKQFFMIGMIDLKGNKFYPIDFFDSADEFVKHRSPPAKYVRTPYPERIEKLDRFLSTNYLFHIQSVTKQCCVRISQIAYAAAMALKQSEYQQVLVCDGVQGHILTEVEEIHGIIEDYWYTESGEALGFKVWNFGHLINCSYEFKGRDAALLSAPQLVLHKPVRYVRFKREGIESGAVKELLLEQKPFKPTPLKLADGREIWVECCLYSCSYDTPYCYQGVSDSTTKNWYYMLKTYGTNTWIIPTEFTTAKRKRQGWNHELFNSLKIVFRGCYVVCGPHGETMFVPDPEAQRIHEARNAHPNFQRAHLRKERRCTIT